MKKLLNYRFWFKTFLIGFLSMWVGLFVFVYAVKGDWFGLFGEIPSFEILENPESELASVLYSSDGQELGKYYRTNRTSVSFGQINKSVIKSLVATEDERYEHHSGIDMRATFRVIKGLITGNSGGGGSTVSQQLAKNLFRMRDLAKYKGPAYNFGPLEMLVIKAKEWIIAARLEKAYTKQEIITMYLNTVNFGLKATGINEAAKTYFNKSPKDLNTQEAAVLIGTLKANTKYDPIKNPENAFGRRNVVMNQMLRYGYLETTEYDSLKNLPVELDYQSQDYNSGIATYFRSKIKNEISQICKDNNYDLFADGLKVYTTIDTRIQKHAEHALIKHMEILQKKFNQEWGARDPWSKGYISKKVRREYFYKNLEEKYGKGNDSIVIALNRPRKTKIYTFSGEKDTLISQWDEFKYYRRFLEAGFIAVNPENGHIKAWVGGLDQKYFGYDHVIQGNRQVGSTFKPVVYAAAIENGFSPCSQILDVPISIPLEDGKIWKPKVKATNKELTLQQCLAYSKNNCAAHLIHKLGPELVANQAVKFGLPREKLKVNLSMALGTSSLSLFDMIRVYTTLVNAGDRIDPTYITRIEDKYGKVIYEKTPKATHVLNPINAYKMITMLRAGVKYGTGRKLASTYGLLNKHNQMGGKTGTTQDSKDGWFFSVNQKLVAGCWVGVQDNNISFRGTKSWYGGSMALPIVGDFYKAVYNDRQIDIQPEPFKIPEGLSDDALAQDFTCQTDTTSSTLYFDEDLADEPL